jgi:aminopeptidase-like protein
MRVAELREMAQPDEIGRSVMAFMEDVFPICRSITGDGLRETLRRIGKLVPIELTEVPSGTRVFDWTIPKEWNIRGAYLEDAAGRRVVDFATSNLHVVNYSTPVRARMTLDELRPHLHSLPDHPTWVPYRTADYTVDWGFCLSDEMLHRLEPGEYDVVIDSSLTDGALTYGECVLPGETDHEVIISSHVCHPSLANDNLSGVAVAVALAGLLAQAERHYTFRFLFAPGTIGAIAWLARNEHLVPRIRHGLVLACVGDDAPIVYKRSRRGDRVVDRAAAHVVGACDTGFGRGEVVDFSPYGNDERQFCSPGFDLPVGAITRSGHDRAVRHHTSADDLASLSPAALADTVLSCLSIIRVLEDNATVTSLCQKGEPQLGRRGLYRSFGGRAEQAQLEMATLWVMNLADGSHDLLDIAERSGLSFTVVDDAARALEAVGLLTRAARSEVDLNQPKGATS